MRSSTELKDFFTSHKDSIGKGWLSLILETYPPDTSDFLKKKKDRFENPVGHAAKDMVDGVMAYLTGEADAGTIRTALHPLVQIRSVQDFSASGAVEVVFLLKRAVLQTVGKELAATTEGLSILLQVDAIVDELVKVAIDIYCDCRERLNDVRTDEIKRNLYMLLKDKGVMDTGGQTCGN